MDIKALIEKCRRQQQQKPGQLEMPLDESSAWASEDESLQEWRSRTIPEGWVTFPADWIEA